MKVKLGKYMHFKNILCEVLGEGRHTETLEEYVVYKHDSKDFGKGAIWVRPKKMFLENVKVDGKEIPRFKYIPQPFWKIHSRK